MAAAGVAGSMMAAGGAALLAGAANTAGGAQAISAAFQKASADASGGGSNMSGDSPDYNSGGGSSSQQTATSPDSTPLGKAMGLSSNASVMQSSVNSSSGIGNAAKIAAGTISNLASGTGKVVEDKWDKLKESAQQRVDQTFPGQVATAIRKETPTFNNNSLSGDNSHDPAAEVAAFVNRSEQA
jgi:type IV secretion system protein VirB6/type IV secretion system protein TrbL